MAAELRATKIPTLQEAVSPRRNPENISTPPRRPPPGAALELLEARCRRSGACGCYASLPCDPGVRLAPPWDGTMYDSARDPPAGPDLPGCRRLASFGGLGTGWKARTEPVTFSLILC